MFVRPLLGVQKWRNLFLVRPRVAIDDDNDGFISRILHFNMHFSAFQHLSGSFRADCIEQLTFER